jgi:hypothetical protein
MTTKPIITVTLPLEDFDNLRDSLDIAIELLTTVSNAESELHRMILEDIETFLRKVQ